MEQVEQGLADLTELLDRYGREIRTISEEALNGGGDPSADEFRGKISGVQERIHREAIERYDQLVGVGAEVEQGFLGKLTHLKERMMRAAVLKEVINSTVRPEGGLTGIGSVDPAA
ncbi:MAG: hypothetical protein ACE5G5_06115 [Candidatus Methylomirabilales bacterium]